MRQEGLSRLHTVDTATHGVLGVYLRARQRPLSLALIVVALAGLVVTAGSVLPALFEDPHLPRPRTSLALGCLLSGLVVIFTRPILPEAERLSAISMRASRLVMAALIVALGGVASLACMAAATPELAWRCVTLGGALTGIGLLAASMGTFWGLILPTSYVMAGLSFGYQAQLGAGWSIQPWAWLVDPSAPVGYELALLALGLAAMTFHREWQTRG